MILIFVAHSDDAVIGCGGTIAKYTRAGKAIRVIAFSYGENTNPIVDPVYLIKRLRKESERAANILGAQIKILGLADTRFKFEIKKPEIREKVKEFLRKYKPEAVLSHGTDDPRLAHRLVARLIKEEVDKCRPKPRLYTFGVDLPLRMISHTGPRLYVDISKVWKLKKKAMQAFKSHREVQMYFYAVTTVRDFIRGLRIFKPQAEVFYRW